VQALGVDGEAQLVLHLGAGGGSTAATMVSSPTRTSSRISEPSFSTTSTLELNVSPSGSAALARCRFSGLMPMVSCWPTWPRKRSACGPGTSISSPAFLAVMRPLPSTIVTVAKFMAGEPMKPATNLLAG
jgi:hypothetical protein